MPATVTVWPEPEWPRSTSAATTAAAAQRPWTVTRWGYTASTGRLDLDDVGAEVGQQHGGDRTGDAVTAVHDPDTAEDGAGVRGRHGRAYCPSRRVPRVSAARS